MCGGCLLNELTIRNDNGISFPCLVESVTRVVVGIWEVCVVPHLVVALRHTLYWCDIVMYLAISMADSVRSDRRSSSIPETTCCVGLLGGRGEGVTTKVSPDVVTTASS